MIRTMLAAAVFSVTGASGGFTQEAAAQQTCGPRAEVIAKLAQDFDEAQEAVGVVNDRAVIELYVSGAGTWTLIASGTDGISCIVSAGKDWEGKGYVKGLDTGSRGKVRAPLPSRYGH